MQRLYESRQSRSTLSPRDSLRQPHPHIVPCCNLHPKPLLLAVSTAPHDTSNGSPKSTPWSLRTFHLKTARKYRIRTATRPHISRYIATHASESRSPATAAGAHRPAYLARISAIPTGSPTITNTLCPVLGTTDSSLFVAGSCGSTRSIPSEYTGSTVGYSNPHPADGPSTAASSISHPALARDGGTAASATSLANPCRNSPGASW
mmetsp:Transcript_28506/g.71527  ORF Transcript_28506/g.71527 Transcript_28506/m.71527 type:complete len:206 (-) Transcript_28506:84-701(-)